MVRSLHLGMLAAFVGGVLLLLGLVVGAFAYDRAVIRNPGPHLDRDHIRSIIAQESPVTYRDGTTRVGVFFDAEHRQFVPWQRLPQSYVMGIVAAEDGRFWYHNGVNPKGIARAMRDNLLAGSVVAGGSTLTQQTSKNLYYRPDRSLKAKLVELLNALRLEAHYDKTEILEFYVNQFHVSGNGRGLGIAARHFFDKEVDQLTLEECAFLAGLVKAPSYYDPYLGDEARRERSVTRAHDRTRYVLRRMVDEPIEHLAGPRPDTTDAAAVAAYEASLLTAGTVRAEAQALLDGDFELEFRRGTFRYESSAVLDEVARRLSEAPFDTLLGDAGIDNAATAGLVVVTTLDEGAQRSATYGLWHHLTEVGIWMERLGPEDFLLVDHRGPRFDPDFPPRAHEFRVARVRDKPDGKTVTLDLGGHACVVDRDGIVRVAVASRRGELGDKNAKAPTAAVDAWLEALPVESVVLASVRTAPADGTVLCDLEVRPELQGAAMVLQQGEIRAMVGGNDNRNFNRATALRQFGSTWKPLVFHAALQLGWSAADTLDNTRNVFPFSTTFYYPRPDHTPASRVSMSWAGVNSENLASIWLLYHLTDPLDGEEVRALASSLGLDRGEDESAKDYRTRIQEAGVLPTKTRMDEVLFLQSRQEVVAGLHSGRHPEDAVALQSLLYGWNYGAEGTRVAREGASARAWKQRALDNNWRTLRERIQPCRFQYGALADALDAERAPDPAVVPDLSVWVSGDQIQVACGALPEGYVVPDQELLVTLGWDDDPLSLDLPDGTDVIPEPRRKRLPGFGRREPPPDSRRPRGPQLVDIEDMFIDDRLHLATLQAVDLALARRTMAWDMQPGKIDMYAPDVLYWHQDFRVLLALRYVASLAEQYGVQTDIQEVLSMPLGASEITLEESASVYGGLTTGQAWEFPGRSQGRSVAAVPTSTLLIQEIRDVDGRVLYKAEPSATEVAPRPVADMTTDILRNVVLHGTGRRARYAVDAGGNQVPIGGKTGTTNDFKNAAFLGFAPSATPYGYHPEEGFVVGTYVGYDDNRPMVQGGIKLAGASGALPAWIATVQGLASSGALGQPDALSAVGTDWPLHTDPSLRRAPSVAGTGMLAVDGLEPSEGTSILVPAAVTRAGPDVRFRPIDRPARISPRTEEALRERPAPSTRVRPRRSAVE